MDSLGFSIGFHAVYINSVREAIDLAFKYHFDSVQIETAMPQFFPERYTLKAREQLRRYARDNQVILKVHAPSEDFSLQTLHTSIQRSIITRLKEVIDFATDLDAKLVTIHPGVVPVFTIPGKGRIPIDKQYPQLHYEGFKSALSELANYSKGKTLLCLENSPYTSTVMNVLKTLLEDTSIFLTWDLAKTYHMDGSINTLVERFFLNQLTKVRECHIHDLNSRGGHQIIGSGFVDFKHYLTLLSHYDIEYTIEVRPLNNALKSSETLKRIMR